MQDHEIIELYNARSETAILQTDKKYGNYCRSISFQIVRCHEDVEECMNDTYLCVWNQIPPKDPPCLRTFLGKIVRNLSFHVFEKKTAAKRGGGEITLVLEELSECIPSNCTTENSIDNILLRDVINDFLKKISSREKYILIHRCWYVDSIKKIANDLDISEANVKVILHRTRKKLKSALEKEGFQI